MHYLSLIYFVNPPQHVSSMYVCIAHHQEVFTVYVQQLVRVIRLGWLSAGRVKLTRPAASQLKQVISKLRLGL
jgi:hypothetical protein